MAPAVSQAKTNNADRAIRLLCFCILATVGMAAIAAALLVGSLVCYSADQALLDTQQRRIEALQLLQRQQEELLANSKKPSVIERAAISHLNYTLRDCDVECSQKLPASWPELEAALTQVDHRQQPAQSLWWQRFSENLIQRPRHRILLGAFGSVLVVISLAFFYRPR